MDRDLDGTLDFEEFKKLMKARMEERAGTKEDQVNKEFKM